MWYKRASELLREEIEAVLAPLAGTDGFYELVKEPLARREDSDNGGAPYPWSLLPLIVCDAISGHYEHALPAAASLQILKATLEIFDDIEDADSSASLSARHGSAVATNVATALLFLAEIAITRLEARSITDHVVVRVIERVNSFYATACAGQHLDLSSSSKMAVSEDFYLKVSGMKSASTVECACYTGALLATANQELIDTFALFGHNLGMASQIANDIHGVTNGSDIMKRKITLPVIYALAQADGEAHTQLERTFGKSSESVADPTQIRDLLFRTGAIHYATIKMELYKQQALEVLSKVERTGANVERLKPFLE